MVFEVRFRSCTECHRLSLVLTQCLYVFFSQKGVEFRRVFHSALNDFYHNK